MKVLNYKWTDKIVKEVESWTDCQNCGTKVSYEMLINNGRTGNMECKRCTNLEI